MSSVNPYEPPKLESADFVPFENAPALWNPNAAANWSLLFSPAFGAYLHARNAERLGRHDEAKSNQRWFYGSLTFLAVNLVSILVPALSDAPLNLVGLLILIIWYFRVARKQAAFVKKTFGTTYQRRSWAQPLLIGFACLVGVFVIAVAFAVIVELRDGGQGALIDQELTSREMF